jgi:hypothetical protein
MNIEVVSSGELIKKLQNVTLRKKHPTDSDIKPYEKALITIETFDPEALAPTQRYVLDTELKKVEKLRWDILEEYPHDIFRLNGYLKCKYDDKTIDIIPPVVEEYIDFRGNIHLLIADGQHRSFLARQMGLPLRVCYIRGVHYANCYYAYPLPDGWNGVKMISSIPDGYIKKFHTVRDHKAKFRDYNSQFDNIGDSRAYAPKQEVSR